MAEDTTRTDDSAQAASSEMVSISVPRHLAQAVQEFVRRLESENEDTRAHMLSLLTTTQTTQSTSKGTDLSMDELVVP